MQGKGSDALDKDANEQQPPPNQSDSPSSMNQPSGSTPFIYPIRSLMSTVQPQPPPNVDPSISNDLAASPQREVAAKREAASGFFYTLAPLSKAANSTAGSGSQPSSDGQRTLVFPSNSPLGRQDSDRELLKSLLPLPALPPRAGGSGPSSSTSSLPIPKSPDHLRRPLSTPIPEKHVLNSSSEETVIKVQDFASTNSRVRVTPVPVTTENLPLCSAFVDDAASSDCTSAAVTARTSQGPDDQSSVSDLVRLPPVTVEDEPGSRGSLRSSPSRHVSGPRPSQESGILPGPQGSGRSVASYERGPPVTTRLKYARDENGHHHIIGREGTLTRCEDEPIRSPGAIQSYGVTVVLEEDPEEGRLIVRQVSENIHRILGLSIPYLFSLDCFTDVLPFDQAELLWKHATFLYDPNIPVDEPSTTDQQSSGGEETDPNYASKMNSTKLKPPMEGPDIFSLSGWSEPQTVAETEPRMTWRCWCAAHRPIVPKRTPGAPKSTGSRQSGSSDTASRVGSEVVSFTNPSLYGVEEDYQHLIILEFELEHDEENPLYFRDHFAQNTPESAGSRTSRTGSANGGGRSGGAGSGSPLQSQPSSGASSGVTTTPTPTAELVNAGRSVDSFPPSAPLTNEALQALDTRPDQRPLNLPSADQVFSPHDTQDPQVTGDAQNFPVDEDDPFSLEGEETWYPSADDIHESTTSRSKPIRALEKMRMMARGLGGSIRQSPTMRRVQGNAGSSGGSSDVASGSGRERGGSPSGGSQRGGNGGSASSRVSRRAAAVGGGNSVGTMDVFAVLADVIEQLGLAADLPAFLKVVVGVIKDLTQFHRVLVYQFDDVWNGQVVAELVDWSASHDLYQGLHFPAADIPAQARELYVINKVRSLYDRDQPTSRLVCRDFSDLDHPLDMTHCYLRAMSPIHCKYLENMGVRASMSVSITAFGQLWGLIACHSYGNHGMRVSFPVRQMLRLLSDSISRNIERLSYAQRLHTRKLINTIPTHFHPTGYIVSSAEDLLTLFDADFGALVIGDGARVLGPSENGREVLAIAQFLRMKQFSMLQASVCISKDYPDLTVPSGMDAISGLLFVPLSPGGQDFVVFLRRGQMKDVMWAGKPQKPGTGAASLEPRTSFKAWTEAILGRCRAWTDEQVETAGVLALVYGKFMEVWRQKETAVKSTQLANLLLTNATHEVRTPLNQIIGYLELALESPLDTETKTNLETTHKASKSLLYTINDLLELTRLESGQMTQFNDRFDLRKLIHETVAPYEKDALRKGLEFHLNTEASPTAVLGDARKVANVVANLTANAVKFTEHGSVTLECKPFSEPDGLRDSHSTATTKEVAVEIVISDTGCGIPTTKLEEIFRQFEQVEHDSNEQKPQGLGLGLAVVARIVEQLGGQLRVDSRVGAGSRFSFLLPFTLPDRSGDSASMIPSGPPSHSTVSEVDDFVTAMSTSHMAREVIPEHSKKSSPAASLQRQPADGVFYVQDSKTAVRGIKIDEFALDRDHIASPARERSKFDFGRQAPSRVVTGDPVPKRPPGQLRVLVVEDDKVNSKLMEKRLKKWNHISVAVENGQEAKEVVGRDFDFDCVLMDLQMPIMDGYQATSAIRVFEEEQRPPRILASHHCNGRIPIFAVSASITENQRDDLWEIGFDGYLLKPIVWDRVQDMFEGTTDPEQRRKDMYTPGRWERGGWLGWNEELGPLTILRSSLLD